MARGVALTTASRGGAEARWWGTGCWGTGLNGLFTGVAEGLVGETGKGCRLAGALVGWRGGRGWTLTGGGPIAWPAVVEHEAQPEQSEEAELVEKKRRYHGEMPSYNDERRAFYVVF